MNSQHDDNAANRYSVSEENMEMQFVDEEQGILSNIKGITGLKDLQLQEEECLAKAYEILLSEVRTDTPLSCELLRHIHKRIFGDIYEWAGKWRTVNIGKPGVQWPPPNHLEKAMQIFEKELLQEYPSERLADDEIFCKSVGYIQGEFLAIHPFREGNARTIKLFTDLLAAQTDRPILLYNMSDEGRQQYIDAAKAAIIKDYGPMIDVIRNALLESMRQSS